MTQFTSHSARAAAVMVASGDPDFRKQVLEALMAARQDGIEVSGGAEALLQLESGPCAGVVLDRRLPDLDAQELAAMLAAQYPQLPVEMLDSELSPLAWPAPAGDGSTARDFRALMQALRLPRASEPLPAAAVRPVKAIPAATASLATAAAVPAAAAELLPGMVGRSAHLGDISGLVRLVAPRRTPVLVLGETGTGKEMIAHALHQASPRAARPFVVVNCAAIPESLLESELFGYVRGAFTGAVQSRSGRILAAHTGTLFLDEIGELPLNLQSKLLRFLQEGELQRLGSNEPQKVDVRVIAATNVDLEAKVEAGEFRRDLYYRLAVFPVELQALRQRPADIVPLARHFLRHLHAEADSPLPQIAPEAMDLLEQYPWPGNVRELQHALERAYILAEGRQTLA
ncbi:MAG TPA: sigma-54 dependent transcriptional regulator, partial [Terriglobales bacterium]|nr:sigma-54 dependent transcriptional regulator [Terriglobales bacterium]